MRIRTIHRQTQRWQCPSVIFRKVTSGFRCEWGAETYAAFRSVVSTTKANTASVLDTIRFVLSPQAAQMALAQSRHNARSTKAGRV